MVSVGLSIRQAPGLDFELEEGFKLGISDSTNYTLSCEKCSIDETVKVIDKGSSWSGSNWDHKRNFANFKTKWSGGGDIMPKITSATCKACGADPKVEVV
jgi:hypothetical protein